MRFLPISLVLLAASSSFAGEPQRILFDRLAPQEIVLYVAKTDGSDEKPLLSVAGGMDYNPAYSADGKWVVFTSERNGSADLYRVKADGSGLERLTEDPARPALTPRFSARCASARLKDCPARRCP